MPISYGIDRLGQLGLRLPDVADLGDRVDPDRERRLAAVRLHTEEVARRKPSLLCGRRRQVREPDHVAGRVDVGHRGPVALVDRDASTCVGLEAGVLELKIGDGTHASRRVEHDVGGDHLAARERRQRSALTRLDFLDALAEPEDDVELAQVVAQRLRDLGIAEVEHRAARIDDRDARSERGEHRCELDTDHAGADDHDRRRQSREAQHDVVGVEDRRAVELDLGRMCRRRPGRDHDPFGRARAVRCRRARRSRACARRRTARSRRGASHDSGAAGRESPAAPPRRHAAYGVRCPRRRHSPSAGSSARRSRAG